MPLPMDQSAWNYVTTRLIRDACDTMQLKINQQMEIGREAGYPFPDLRFVKSAAFHAIPRPLEAFGEMWGYGVPGQSTVAKGLVDTIFGYYKSELRDKESSVSPEHFDFFVHRNVRTIIINQLNWLWGQFKKIEPLMPVPEEEEDTTFGIIGVDPGDQGVVGPGTGFQVGPAPGENGTSQIGLPSNGDDVYYPGTPGDDEEGADTGTGEPEGGWGDRPPGYPPDWPWPPTEGLPEEKEEIPWGTIAAIAGGVVLVLLLKK